MGENVIIKTVTVYISKHVMAQFLEGYNTVFSKTILLLCLAVIKFIFLNSP